MDSNVKGCICKRKTEPRRLSTVSPPARSVWFSARMQPWFQYRLRHGRRNDVLPFHLIRSVKFMVLWSRTGLVVSPRGRANLLKAPLWNARGKTCLPDVLTARYENSQSNETSFYSFFWKREKKRKMVWYFIIATIFCNGVFTWREN